jgi:release factor glutamine methyltransferase
MTTDAWLAEKTVLLRLAGIATARLDCLILLEDVLHTDRTHLLAHPDTALSAEQQVRLTKMMQRRAVHEPLAYIRNKVEFYGRSFYVDARVLVPRPETEAIINLLTRATLPGQPVIADIGTGSGALAVTAALELPQAHIIATDISSDCLEVAARNARQHHVDITFLEGALTKPLATLHSYPNILLCNLPYVPTAYPINQAAKYEPASALFGGNDGLDLYRRLFTEIADLEQAPILIFTESFPDQHADLAAITNRAGYRLRAVQGFAQLLARG